MDENTKDLFDLFGTFSKMDNKEWRFVWNSSHDCMANIRLDARNTEEQAINKIKYIIKSRFSTKK